MQNLNSNFGKNLKLIRLTKNLTQEKLSELIEIDQRQLTMIETGNSFPSAKTIERRCAALNVPVSELFNFGQEDFNCERIMLLVKAIKRIQKDENKIKFVELAIKSLDDKKSMEKLQNMIEGMLLIK